MTDFTDVPKDPAKNMQYRMFMWDQAARDAGLRAEIIAACREDIIYFLSAWCFLHEPRPGETNGISHPKIIPFIPWEHQYPVIRSIRKHLGLRDIGIEKSRGEGMSWIGLLLALQQWLFDYDPVNIGMVSSTEDKADTPGNMDSLLSKLDWELLQLPPWMSGKLGVDYLRNKNEHTLVNVRNASQIVAFAAASGGPRGGRYTWFLMDELSSWRRGPDDAVMASSQQATKSRLVISTPLGSDGAYYKFMHTDSNAVILRLDWKDNPSRNRGMYQLQKGKPVAVDPEGNPLPQAYRRFTPEISKMFESLRRRGFVLENRVRSPWYDEQCYRADSSPQSIAQELDRDYGGSVTRFFGESVDLVLAESVRPPLKTYDVKANSATLELTWDAKEGGAASMWCPLDVKNRPPRGSYCISADVATGLGGAYSSNSVLTIINATTREQVFELATNQISAMDLADIAVGLCKVFYDAYLSWEHMGPGVPFGRRVLDEHHYTRSFLRNVITKAGKQKSKDFGFITRGDMRILAFEELKDFVLKKKVIIRSSEAAAEFPQYIEQPGPKIFHVHDPGERNASHGDRVISLLVAVQAMQDVLPTIALQKGESADYGMPDDGTLARRIWDMEQGKNNDDVWDRRTSAQLTSNYAYAG